MRLFMYSALAPLFLGLIGCDEKLPQGDPAASVSTGRFGIRAEANVAVDVGLKPRFLQLIVSGRTDAGPAAPKAIEILNEMSSCVFARPDPAAKVVYLTARHFTGDTNIHTFDALAVQTSAQHFVNDWRQKGSEPRVRTGDISAELKLANVIVTETSAPIHLVLASGGKALYNLMVAKDARISGISLIAPLDSGLANLPPGVPVSVLGPKQVQTCDAHPHMRPKPDWQISRMARESPGNYAEPLARLNALHHRFDGFFRHNFNQASELRVIGGERIANFLVGPAPSDLSARVPFRGIGGSTVLLTRAENVVQGTTEDLRKALAAKVRPVAEGMASGSLAALNR